VNRRPERRPELALRLQVAAPASDLPARATLRRWIQHTLETDAEITLRFVGIAEGRRLNRAYRGKDYATNVLTFGYRGPPQIEADIVVCLPVVRREARAAARSLRAHLAHLVIHGVLHAQGYDHQRPREAERMQRREVELLAALRIGDPYN
jgi:probable rRNA maturation factor